MVFTCVLSCTDTDECLNETICGDHGFCENTDGSFSCQCDQGYTTPPGDPGQACVGAVLLSDRMLLLHC